MRRARGAKLKTWRGGYLSYRGLDVKCEKFDGYIREKIQINSYLKWRETGNF